MGKAAPAPGGGWFRSAQSRPVHTTTPTRSRPLATARAMGALSALTLLALAGASATAQTQPPAASASAASAPPAGQASTPQRVEVTGGRESDNEQRRQSTAAKIVIGREEIERFGDSTVGEVLKRLPGVTTSGAPGRGGPPRMRATRSC